MITLDQSRDPCCLARILGERLKGHDPWSAPRIVVPGPCVRDWLMRRLSGELGIVAGLEFSTLEDLLGPQGPGGGRRLSRQTMLHLMLDLLQDPESLPPPVRSWLANAGDAPRNQARWRFQFAQRHVDLWRGYALDRPEMLREWRHGHVPDESPGSWQAPLWKTFDGRVRGRWWDPLEQIRDLAGPVGPDLHIFAVSWASRLTLEALQALAQTTPVHVYLLHESHGGARARWCRPVASLQSRLQSLGAVPEETPDSHDGSGDLETLKSILLGRATPQEPLQDGSVGLMAAPSARREVESVVGLIWDRLASEGGTFDDCVLLLPADSFDEYAAHILAVSQESHGLPVSRLPAPSPLSRILVEALDLVGETPSFDQVVALMSRRVVLAGRPWSLDDVRHWLRAAGFGSGLDEMSFTGTDVDLDVSSWQQALERLALGMVTGPDVTPIAGKGREWLPAPVAGEDQGSLGSCLQWMSEVCEWYRRARGKIQEWSDWQKDLHELADLLAGPECDGDQVAESLGQIEFVADPDLQRRPVSSGEMAELCRGLLSSNRTGSSSSVGEGIIVAAVRDMRAVPKRHVFVLGLGDGLFPRRDHPDSLDLRSLDPLSHEVSEEDLDMMALRDCVLAARDSLTLSWVARDPDSGDTLEPSRVVTDLQDFFQGKLIPRTPAFHRHHEPALTAPGTSLPRARDEALSARDPGPAMESWRTLDPRDENRQLSLPSQVDAGESPRVSVATLSAFLRHPFEGWASWRLGLRNMEEHDFWEGAERLNVEFPQLVGVLRQIALESLHASKGAEVLYDARLRELQLLGQAPVGRVAEALRRHHLDWIGNWQSGLRSLGDLKEARGQTVCWGPQRDASSETIGLPEVSVTAGAGRTLSLSGRSTGALYPGHHVLLAASSTVSPRHVLRPWVELMVSRAGGMDLPDEFWTVVIPRKGLSSGRRSPQQGWLRVTIPSVDRAAEWLENVMQDLVRGDHLMHLPVDAVVRHWAAAPEQRHAACDDQERPTALWAHAASLEVPDNADELSRRRLGLWLDDWIQAAGR